MLNWKKIKTYLQGVLEKKEPLFIAPLPFEEQEIKLMWQLNVIFFVGVCLWGIWGFFSPFFEPSFSLEGKNKENKIESLSIDLIENGPFGFHGIRNANPPSRIAQNLLVLGYNHRPDIKDNNQSLLLCLQDSLEKRMVSSGEKIFLFQDKHSLFHFSFQPNRKESNEEVIGVTPFILGTEGVRVEISDGANFILKPVFRREGLEKEAFLQSLKKAKCLGKDLLLQHYGGGDYFSLTKKHKIDFQSHVLFVQEGDFLFWKEGEWRLLGKEDSSQFLPLVQVKTSSLQGLELDVWDESGFNFSKITISLQESPKIGYKVEDLFSQIHLKNGSEAVCLLGKRRVVIKQGDWLLKTEIGWRKLKNASDIDDYLEHKIRGELFIFDKIETLKDRAVLKGKFFDSTRAQMIPFSLSPGSEKKGADIDKKRGSLKSAKVKKVGRF